MEPAACPSLTRGRFAYDFGDTGKLTPLVKMHTLGSHFTPPPFHAGGLRYHGMAPMISHIRDLGLIEARAFHQTECFAAGLTFAKAEGILPAPEANHAVKGAIEEALRVADEFVARAKRRVSIVPDAETAGMLNEVAEIALARKVGRAVIGLGTWALGRDAAGQPHVLAVQTPEEAVAAALANCNN